MDNPNRINPTALTPTVPRQTPDNDFGKVLTRTVANGVQLGVQLAAPVLGPSIASAAGNLVSQVSGQAAVGAQVAMGTRSVDALVKDGTSRLSGTGGSSGGGTLGGPQGGGAQGTGGAAGTGSDQWDMLEAQRLMNSENQRFNLAYLGLQDAMQKESREFNAISNIMKVRHDSAKAAINNIR
jgi:hypothetical protein